MAIRSPEFIEAAGILINAGSLEIPDEGSVFEPITGDPPDGQSPHCAVVDEFHEHQTSALYDTMQTGMGARRQPMIFTITTAGFDIEGPCYDLRSRVQEMLLGTVPDEELFGWIMTRNILSSTVKQHTLVFSLTEANGSCDGFRITTDGIYSSVSNSSSRHGYKGTITPAIVKTNAMEITWRINLSWGRYVS